MKLFGALLILCSSQAYVAEATLNEILTPFQALVKWTHSGRQSKVTRFGLENTEPVHRRPEIEYFTPGAAEILVGPKLVALRKDARGRPVLVLEDIVETSSSELTPVSPVSVTAASSPLSSSLSSSPSPPLSSSSSSLDASFSDDSISVTSPAAATVAAAAATTTSVSSVSAPSSEANIFHMVDLRIPGGENPDSEALPDVAIFRPQRPLETDGNGDKRPEKAESSLLTTEAQNLLSSTAAPTPAIIGASPVAPVTTTATTTAAAAASEAASSSRSTTEESARQSDRFVQTIHRPVQSRVVQDVNELFQSED